MNGIRLKKYFAGLMVAYKESNREEELDEDVQKLENKIWISLTCLSCYWTWMSQQRNGVAKDVWNIFINKNCIEGNAGGSSV